MDDIVVLDKGETLNLCVKGQAMYQLQVDARGLRILLMGGHKGLNITPYSGNVFYVNPNIK